ncbi:P-loop containing nucleoside triphosphate hydrolase protein [Gloeophyllum trabeum ATCC 11539]|uniref:ATP-dependent DNA helicase n=1 Tax=Gloeophyllum trabeum (strain ATCC 11539 / FP-39264 / Madison 617) TaxID=670483 RepID=S7QN89_GLOTA|nr:P-loop containing nucleoside triphosphate hydrolase protein [Gloeophyllum trabeum ATCC 11539]EPQ60917.1 P-loop containing nucleoside triphosphate hydrolase protein [Gloeophyllum trabeum ATCC 11539]
MSSDGYFSDEFDASLLNQVSAIEAAHLSPANSPKKLPPTPSAPAREDSDFDFSFDDYGEVEAELQRIEQTALKKQNSVLHDPGAGPSRQPLARTASRNTVQTTLFGDVLQPQASSNKPHPSTRAPLQRVKSNSRNPFGKPAKKVLQWDHTEFAKTGWKRGSKLKGKGKFQADEDEEDEELVEFEQFPNPVVSGADVQYHQPPPMKLQPDRLAMKTWIYPLNKPKRDYQFNIVRNSLFENTLVALPTGLGKTFIAGVVMLNFYRWFPEGKVVFVAPTKPLVSQQIEACHKTCGIPGTDAAELTGAVATHIRARHWGQKRVFYMTPQTFMSDLATERCDPMDIILLVIDEAHKGTGDYAYAQVMRYMMAKNPHFRVLALTATPGGKPEVVQDIVRALHISKIEIRDENSIDLQGYMHKKITEQHKIVMNEDIVKIRNLLAKLMDGKMGKLRQAGLLRGSPDPVMLQPFSCNLGMQDIQKRPDRQSLTWAYPALKVLGQLARAMGYLLECSISMCYKCLQEISGGSNQETGKQASSKQAQSSLQKDRVFQELMHEMEKQYNRGLAVHPKMEKLKALLIEHFVKATEEPADDQDGPSQTRAMVFVTYRECVDEVVEWLNQESPMITATKFVGQGADKQGNKGFGQKEQLEVIRKFKAGEFNVLVATSVGEEGLDIGELDMVICYDAQSTPIRMLQRIGRTGRKRDGYIHVLVAENREEANWAKAKTKYQEVQQSIVRGEDLQLYSDVERLLPDDVNPQCIEMEMDIQEYVRDTKEKTVAAVSEGNSPRKSKKRKRNDDPLRNVPAGAASGFLSVRDLIAKGAPKKRKKNAKGFDEQAGEDDDVDAELEGGLFTSRRCASTPAAESSPKPKKLRKTKTAVEAAKATKTKKRKTVVPQITSSQLSRRGEDDSDDMEIERGLALQRRPSPPVVSPMPSSSPPRPTSERDQTIPSSPDVPLADIIEIESESPSELSLGSDDEIFGAAAISESRASSEPPLPALRLDEWEPDGEEVADIPSSPQASHEHNGPLQDMSWLLDDDEDLHLQVADSSSMQDVPAGRDDEDGLRNPRVVKGRLPLSSSINPANPGMSPIIIQSSPSEQRGTVRRDMPPPPLPVRFQTAREVSGGHEMVMPEASFAVGALRARRKRPRVVADVDSSPVAPRPRRLRRADAAATSADNAAPMKQRRRRQLVDPGASRVWLDVEAAHSGDESSEGESDDFEEVANESDRRFLQELPETQVSPSYDQAAAYRQSLFTQAPAPGLGPVFAHNPVRQYPFGPDRGRRPIQTELISSSPRQDDDVRDEYAIGSFVVDDEAEISYHEDSSEL